MLKIPYKDLTKLAGDMGYKGCKNCKYQVEPLRMCEWAEKGGDGHVHFICPKWEKEKANAGNKRD